MKRCVLPHSAFGPISLTLSLPFLRCAAWLLITVPGGRQPTNPKLLQLVFAKGKGVDPPEALFSWWGEELQMSQFRLRRQEKLWVLRVGGGGDGGHCAWTSLELRDFDVSSEGRVDAGWTDTSRRSRFEWGLVELDFDFISSLSVEF